MNIENVVGHSSYVVAQKQTVVQDKAQLLSNEIDRLKQQVNKAEQEKKVQLDWFTKALTTATRGQEE
jgi:uncharacterized membrane protein YgcG